MIPVAFDYARPTSLGEAVAVLAAAGGAAKVLAGGQSLLPVMRLRLAYPELLVDLGRIPALRGVREEPDAIVVGAMTTHDEVLHDPLIAAHAPLVAAATATVADRQVRHRGTFGGSLAHADPAGDLPAVAVALDAEMVLTGPGGSRRVLAQEFFVDYLTTALGPDEVLTEIRLPKLGSGWGVAYEKFNRVAQAWSIVGVAAAVRVVDGQIAAARVGLTNMGPTPVRALAVEAMLAGAAPDAVETAAEAASEGTDPPGDLSGAPDYRAHLARVLTARAVRRAGGLAASSR